MLTMTLLVSVLIPYAFAFSIRFYEVLQLLSAIRLILSANCGLHKGLPWMETEVWWLQKVSRMMFSRKMLQCWWQETFLINTLCLFERSLPFDCWIELCTLCFDVVLHGLNKILFSVEFLHHTSQSLMPDSVKYLCWWRYGEALSSFVDVFLSWSSCWRFVQLCSCSKASLLYC